MNSSRMNKLEELGRVDSEKLFLKKVKEILNLKRKESLENLNLMVEKSWVEVKVES